MIHQCRLTVRSYECDEYRHVNNAVYLNYLEYARMEFIRAAGLDYEKFRSLGFGIIVSKVCISYKLPAVLGDELVIFSKSVKKRLSHGVFHQAIMRGNDLIAEAEVTWVCVGSDGKPTRLPPEFDCPALTPHEENLRVC